MNSLLRHAQRIIVALTLAAFLTVQAAPVMSSVQIGDASAWVTLLVNCDDDTCG